MYKVSSEIYKETDFETVKNDNGKVVSKFKFRYPSEKQDEQLLIEEITTIDKDGDLNVKRKNRIGIKQGVIEIEHSEATELRLVGLQVWRGALLLADFIFHNRNIFKNYKILELGAGVGLTSIAAAVYAKQVYCTDVDIGGILDLIRVNVQRNRKLCSSGIQVLEYNFLQKPEDYAPALLAAINECDVIVAADVIYEDELTDAFIHVIQKIFDSETKSKRKTIYVALEKRYVFTLSELDAVAPMFEYFIKQTMNKAWHFEYIPIDFPQYFDYERCQQLVLLKLTNSGMTK